MEQQAGDEFDRHSWHDNTVYGIRFDVGDGFAGDFHSDLVLDIDHIVEWDCAPDGSVRFRVAPATLAFHNVTDLRIAVDFGDSGCRTNINELSIDAITRERQPSAEQKICLDRPYWRWRIALNHPAGGEIAFGASGFSQALRAVPVLCEEQRLPAERRA